MTISSCATTERKAKQWAYSNKGKLAEWCSDCFPVKPIEVVKGDTVVRVDSIVKADSVRVVVQADCPDGTKVKVDCPPTKIVTRVVKSHSTDTIKVRDTAYERVQEDRVKNSGELISRLTKQVESERKAKEGWRKLGLIALGIIGVYGLLKVKRVF